MEFEDERSAFVQAVASCDRRIRNPTNMYERGDSMDFRLQCLKNIQAVDAKTAKVMTGLAHEQAAVDANQVLACSGPVCPIDL